MSYSEMIADCSEIRTESTNILSVVYVDFIYFKPGGTYISHLV